MVRWCSLGDCFGEVTAVPSDELDSHDPVGLGGWGRRAARASWTWLKSKMCSEAVTGADIGMVKVGAGSSTLAANTALESGELRDGFSLHCVNPSRPPSRLKRALSGGLALCWVKVGNWNMDALRVK